MTPPRAAYRFFALTLALLIGYALVHLLALLVLSPADLRPFAQLDALAAALLDLALISGLIGGGIYALQADQADPRPLLRVALWIDWLLAILTLAAGVLDALPNPLLSAATRPRDRAGAGRYAAARPALDGDPAGLELRHRLEHDLSRCSP